MIMVTEAARRAVNGKCKYGLLTLYKKSPGHGESTLGARTAGNTNPAGTYHYKRTGLKRLSVFIQHSVELFDFGLQGGAWKAKEDEPSVGEALLKDQLAEIAVCNHQNPLLVPGDGKYILIGKPVGVMAGDGGNVMAEFSKVRNQSEVSALVEEEFHRVASDRAPLGGLGETSSPVTRSLA